MSDLAEQFSKIIGQKADRIASGYLLKGIAKDINEAEGTLTLAIDGEPSIPNVSMNAHYSSGGYFLLVPRQDSPITVGYASGKKDVFVVEASIIDKLKVKIATLEFALSADGMRVEKDGENLKDCINDYMVEVDKILVVQGNNINKGATAAIKTRINKILC